MVALFFEIYGAFCFFSLIAFLVLASVAKLRPDLDEEIDELEKLKKLASFPFEDLIIKDPSRLAQSRPIEQSKRLIQTRPHLIHLRKPRTT
jgi:hypothetical protein